MKVALIHIGFFIGLIILGILSFFTIFGIGFTEGITLFSLTIPFVLSVGWNFAYMRVFLGLRSNEVQSVRPPKNWTFVSMFLSGIFIVYSLLMATMLLPILSVISVFLLLIWYALLFAYTKSKSSFPQIMYGSILLIVSLFLAYLTFRVLITS